MSGSDLGRLSRLVLDEMGRVQGRFDGIDTQFVDMRGEVRTIRQHLAELEKASKNLAGFSKEIDHLHGRIASIEKHLGLQRDNPGLDPITPDYLDFPLFPSRHFTMSHCSPRLRRKVIAAGPPPPLYGEALLLRKGVASARPVCSS